MLVLTMMLWPDEVRIRVERLNLDAASFRQLRQAHHDDGDAVRRAVLEIVATRGKMQNPETGSGGMLVGTVEEVGAESRLGLAVGEAGGPRTRLVVVSHWNNHDGGAELDTSHCFVGKERFQELVCMLPSEVTVVGIDEHTAVTIDVS